MVPRAILESLGVRVEKRLRLRTADGRVAQRDIGYALVRAAGVETIDEIVFGEDGDMVLLGSRSLAGMNLRVDAREKRLVDAGPIAAASACQNPHLIPGRRRTSAGCRQDHGGGHLFRLTGHRATLTSVPY